MNRFEIEGQFHVRHYNGQGVLLNDFITPNKITLDAKKDVMDVLLRLQTSPTGWYVGLIDASWNDFENNSPNPVANEFTDYDEATRVQIDTEFGTAAVVTTYAEIENDIGTDPVTFTISTGVSAVDIDGIFIIDSSAKSAAASSYIWCTAAFGNTDATPVPITVNAADVIKVSYKCRIAV